MTIIAEPEATPTAPAYLLPSTGAVLETLAAAADLGLSLDTALLAGLLAAHHNVPPAEAVELARYDAFDERVRDAGGVRNVLLTRAQAARLMAEYDDDDAVAGVR
ncbi:MAG: hypothetical protein JWO11_4114 [Nocardioides sp.]|nr:hypothetical protein [Nocardioides sp.]